MFIKVYSSCTFYLINIVLSASIVFLYTVLKSIGFEVRYKCTINTIQHTSFSQGSAKHLKVKCLIFVAPPTGSPHWLNQCWLVRSFIQRHLLLSMPHWEYIFLTHGALGGHGVLVFEGIVGEWWSVVSRCVSVAGSSI